MPVFILIIVLKVGMKNELAFPSDNKSRIAVVIPAYKVENQIAMVIENIPQFVEKIIVVDDASPDKTKDVLSSLTNPRLIVINHNKNSGVGGGLVQASERAASLGMDILVKMDGDDQMDPNHIIDLVQPIMRGNVDYTKGNRFLNQSQLASMPFVRRIGNRGLTFLVKASSGYWNIFDPSNGFTAIHAFVWQQLKQENIARDFFFECSLLNELYHHRAVVQDVAVPAR